MFSNETIQSTFNQLNGKSFDGLRGFGMYSSSNATFYYVMDPDANKTYILNDEWKFISFKIFDSPMYMMSINNSLYMTGDYNVWKLDQDLNILIQYNATGAPRGYRGISYNPSKGLIYVVGYYYWLREIHVFNLEINLIRRVSTKPHQPWSIAFSSNKLYVGTQERIILVYQNEEIINQFNGCNGNSYHLTSILFDQNGYMATSCLHTNKLYLFSQNGSFTSKSITTGSYPRFIGFDSKGRFILISSKQISIYN